MSSIHTFPNGFRMIYEKSTNNNPITSIKLICDMGSAYETKNIRGVSHFIEHMCFKGTHKYKNTDLFKEYDNAGAYINASTDKRYTEYTINCRDANVHRLLDIISDMVLNSTFNKKEFDKELKVVIEENIEDNDDNESIVINLIDSILYKGTSFEHPIDHTDYHKKGSLTYKNVMDAYHLYYQPSNFILSIVTQLSMPTIVKYIKSTVFIRPTTNSHIQTKHLLYKPVQIEPFPKYITKKLSNSNSSYLTIGFRTCSQYSPDKYALYILKNIMGGYFSSLLFMLLRENNGLTYSPNVSTEYTEIMGDFTISAMTDHTKLLRNGDQLGVLPLIINMLNNIIKKGISKSDFLLSKNYIRGSIEINSTDNEISASHNAEYMLLYANVDKYIPYKNIYNEYYKNITLDQVNDVIKKYLKKENMILCVAGQYIPTPNVIKHYGNQLSN